MSDTNTVDWVEAIGKPAYASIVEMVAALNCDYDRLEELRDERDGFEIDDIDANAAPDGPNYKNDAEAWADENPDDAEELAELIEAAGDCADRDEAFERIQDDALDVTIRGEKVNGEWEADEFIILLSTGGPAVRIKGELSNGEPSRAWLEVQDWFKPWTEYFPADGDTLLTYAQQFCFE